MVPVTISRYAYRVLLQEQLVERVQQEVKCREAAQAEMAQVRYLNCRRWQISGNKPPQATVNIMNIISVKVNNDEILPTTKAKAESAKARLEERRQHGLLRQRLEREKQAIKKHPKKRNRQSKEEGEPGNFHEDKHLQMDVAHHIGLYLVRLCNQLLAHVGILNSSYITKATKLCAVHFSADN